MIVYSAFYYHYKLSLWLLFHVIIEDKTESSLRLVNGIKGFKFLNN